MESGVWREEEALTLYEKLGYHATDISMKKIGVTFSADPGKKEGGR